MRELDSPEFRASTRRVLTEFPSVRMELGELEASIAKIAVFEAGLFTNSPRYDITEKTFFVFKTHLGQKAPATCMPKFSITGYRGYDSRDSSFSNFTVLDITLDRKDGEEQFGAISSGLGMHGPLHFWIYENGQYTLVDMDGPKEDGSNLDTDQIQHSIRTMGNATMHNEQPLEIFI